MAKNTTKCDRCEKPIEEDTKAYCFHNDDFQETFICELCVAEVYNEYVKEMDEK